MMGFISVKWQGQCEDSKFTTSRLNQKFSSGYDHKISCLKKNNLRKKSAINKSFSKFLTYDPVVHSHSLTKNGAHVRYFRRSTEKILMQLWEKLLGGNVAGVESFPAILINNSTAEALRHGLCKIALINFGKFFERFFLSFLQQQTSNLQVPTSLKMTYLIKIHRTYFLL